MTRKDFAAVASAVAAVEDLAVRQAIAERLAIVLSRAAPRFDRAKFLTACGAAEEFLANT